MVVDYDSCSNTAIPLWILGFGLIVSFFIRIFILYDFWAPLTSFISSCLCCFGKCRCRKANKSPPQHLPKELEVSTEGRKDLLQLCIACHYKLNENEDFQYESIDSLNEFEEKVVLYYDHNNEYWGMTFKPLRFKMNIAIGVSNKNTAIEKLYDCQWKMVHTEWVLETETNFIERNGSEYIRIDRKNHMKKIVEYLRSQKLDLTTASDDDFAAMKHELFSQNEQLAKNDDIIKSFGNAERTEVIKIRPGLSSLLKVGGWLEFNYQKGGVYCFDDIVNKDNLANVIIGQSLEQAGLGGGQVPFSYFANEQMQLTLQINNDSQSGKMYFNEANAYRYNSFANDMFCIAKCVHGQWYVNHQMEGPSIKIKRYKNKNYRRLVKQYFFLVYMTLMFIFSLFQWYLDIVSIVNELSRFDNGWQRYQCLNLILFSSPNMKQLILMTILLQNRRRQIKLGKYPTPINVIIGLEKALIPLPLFGSYVTHLLPSKFVFGLAILLSMTIFGYVCYFMVTLAVRFVKYILSNCRVCDCNSHSQQQKQVKKLNGGTGDKLQELSSDTEDIVTSFFFIIAGAMCYLFAVVLLGMQTKLYNGTNWWTSIVETFTERKTAHFIDESNQSFNKINQDASQIFQFIFRFL